MNETFYVNAADGFKFPSILRKEFALPIPRGRTEQRKEEWKKEERRKRKNERKQERLNVRKIMLFD